jgi:hypothetical protein
MPGFHGIALIALGVVHFHKTDIPKLGGVPAIPSYSGHGESKCSECTSKYLYIVSDVM